MILKMDILEFGLLNKKIKSGAFSAPLIFIAYRWLWIGLLLLYTQNIFSQESIYSSFSHSHSGRYFVFGIENKYKEVDFLIGLKYLLPIQKYHGMNSLTQNAFHGSTFFKKIGIETSATFQFWEGRGLVNPFVSLYSSLINSGINIVLDNRMGFINGIGYSYEKVKMVIEDILAFESYLKIGIQANLLQNVSYSVAYGLGATYVKTPDIRYIFVSNTWQGSQVVEISIKYKL